MKGDDDSQVWLASSEEIASLEYAAGVTRNADGREAMIDALLEVEINAERLYWEETRPADHGDVELFYLLDDGGGCQVDVLTKAHWTPPAPS